MVIYKQGDEYDRASEDGSKLFQRLIAAYYAGRLTLRELRTTFEDRLSDHYLRMALLALDGERELTERDLRFIETQLANNLEYLDRFIEDIGSGQTSEQRATWRAGLYGFPRAVYINFTVPPEVGDLMPVLPGDDCLGGVLCGCWLDVEYNDDGDMLVTWVVDPAKENCPVCLAHAMESPFIFTRQDIAELHSAWDREDAR